MATEMFKIDVAGADPAPVCNHCLENEDWFGETRKCCPSEVAELQCSNSTHADALTGALRRSIKQRRENQKSRMLYKMVVVPQ